MASNRNLSVLVEKQLPDFISAEYDNFSKFLQKYYEQLESTGQPLDIIGNIEKYHDIDFYEKSVLTESTVLSSNINTTVSTIGVQSTEGFPRKNGYISIDDEIIFYKSKTSTTFVDCYRNVSGTTKLGDIYNKSTFKTVNPSENGTGESHQVGSVVTNISNLFLYAFVKNFEKQYLDGFPEELLRQEVDKKVLIKNIKNFYRAKGTDQSIQFIFNSIVARDAADIPTVYYPKDSTIKSSSGEWVDKYSLQVKVLSGDVTKLIGSKIIQDVYTYDSRFQYAFAIVDDVIPLGDKNGDTLYEIVLAEETVNGRFEVTPKTFLTSNLSSSLSSGNKIDVYSTSGWEGNEGEIIIGNETIFFRGKNVNQFTVLNRTNPQNHIEGTLVYSNSVVTGAYEDSNGNTQVVKLLSLGYLYNLNVSSAKPYSKAGDKIEISASGNESLDVIYRDTFSGNSRWKINETFSRPSLPSQSVVQTSLNEVISDVSAVYEDEQYFYIASSGFPSHDIGPFNLTSPQDQKNLKLIKKYPITTTEVYETPANDVGVLVNGVKIYSYKDSEQVVFGNVEKITVTNQGNSYADPPYVLINGNATARAVLSGEVVDNIVILNGGSGYTADPQVTITSGRNAVITATVTGDRVTRLNIVNPGEYYSTPPRIVIRDANGRGRYASYTAEISNIGQIIGFQKIDEGKFYTQENVVVDVIPVGSGSTATASVKRWRKNRYTKYQSELDYSYGAYFSNNNPALGYGYGYVANPRYLRINIADNLLLNGLVPGTLSHSPILGYAYDGNPIYGPYGYSNPLNSTSNISRITSSYSLKISRPNGPSDPLGTYIEDYEYIHRSGMLDENNGRYCVTPEYPNGIYAYFLTITDVNVPVFPYFVGKNFYSLPVDSNYTGFISQDELPKNVKRLRTSKTRNNGIDIEATIDSVSVGGVSRINVESSTSTFSVNNAVILSKEDEYVSASASIEEINGKSISTIQSRQTKIIQILTRNDVYLFDGDSITQQNTGAVGTVVGNVFDSNNIAVRVQYGTFNTTNTFDSNRKILSFILDRSSTFSQDSFVSLTNGSQTLIESVSSNRFNISINPFSNGDTIVFTSAFNQIQNDVIYYVTQSNSTSFRVALSSNGAPITVSNSTNPGSLAVSQKAYGRILRDTLNQNTVRVESLRGTFDDVTGYYLNSSTLEDTIGARIVSIVRLSNNITPASINDNVALVTTSTPHEITVGDTVTVDIIPQSSSTTTTYNVRKRIYQDVILNTPTFTANIQDSGVGSSRILNSGEFYAASTSGIATFNDVELYFVNQNRCRDQYGIEVSSDGDTVVGKPGDTNNARANITISGGKVVSVSIVSKGSKYRVGDLLTVEPSDLDRSTSLSSTKYFIFEVLHAGFAVGETVLNLTSIDELSNNDLLRVGNEIVRVSSINNAQKSITVVREVENTIQENHFDTQEVSLYNNQYRFNFNYAMMNGSGSPRVISYDSQTQRLVVAYEPSQSLSSISEIISATTFFDESTPAKIVSVRSVEESPSYKFEFSSDSGTTWAKNPTIDVQRYYTYRFDLSDTSLSGSFLDFSPSGNFNILSSETRKSSVLPGTPNSFVSVIFGLGNFYDVNSPAQKELLNRYTNYFYYDKSGIIKSDKAFLRVIEDPLQGRKEVTYVTPTSFLYDLNRVPQYDGSGSMSYTTNSVTAFGSISKIKVSNPGSSYGIVPVVIGIRPYSAFEARLSVNWNSSSKKIESVNVISGGLNYSKPKVIIEDGDGSFAEFSIIKNDDNSIRTIDVTNSGKNYTYKPTLRVIETDLKAYCESDNIGLPKSVKLKTNGFSFDIDKTTGRNFTSSIFLTLKNFQDDSFLEGEEIVQYDGNNLIAKGYVSRDGWKSGRNVLKLERVSGSFKEGISISGNTKRRTALVYKIFFSIFSDDIRPYYDNMGYFASDNSILSSAQQRIADSYFYQDYSYVIRSKTPIDIWRNIIKKTIHPAGFNVFGELQIESSADTKTPSIQPNSNHISIINLWDPVKNVVTVASTTRKITQIVLKKENINVLEGRGSVSSNEYDTGETIAYEFILANDFNGYFNEAGNRDGDKTFTMQVLGSSNALTVNNINNTIVSLDGIVQEPSEAYFIGGTVGTNAPSSSSITFAQAPLGYRDIFGNSIPVASYNDGLDSPPQKFIGRYLKLKNSTDNTNYFKKIRDISSQFDNQRTTFDLYYDDNTPVELSSGENLLISIDGVIQKQGVTPVIPFDRAYYIRKTVVPNQIVFVEPPRKFQSQSQSFFGFNISGAIRLKIDERYITGSYTGSYILRSSLTGQTISVDEERNLLVFVDGVLQSRTKSYTVRGANITFNEALRPGASVYILFVYGKKIQNSLTAFNFEEVPFFNRFNITISGSITPSYVRDFYDVKVFSNSANGTIKKWYYNGINTVLTIDSLNSRFVTGENITIQNATSDGQDYVIDSTRIVNIADFEQNDNTLDILRKSYPNRLIDAQEKTKISEIHRNFVEIGDLIKIDGENSYREVLNIPKETLKTNYRNEDDLTNSYYGIIPVTGYNDISFGEGLDIVAEVSGGKVTSLIWNQKDYPFYRTIGINPKANAYGYENAPQLMFVSQPQKNSGGGVVAPAQGGGAKAFAVVENGEVIDVVLYDGGSGYLVPPRVYVTKNYKIIKQSKKIDSDIIYIGMSPQIQTGDTLFITTGDSLSSPGGPPIQSISSLLTVTPFDTERFITAIIQREVKPLIPSSQQSLPINSIIEPYITPLIQDVETNIQIITLRSPVSLDAISNVTINQVNREIVSSIRSFLKVKTAPVYPSIYETGAYLVSDIDIDDTVAFVADTSKFLTAGKLLIEDEIVYYSGKLSDRFYNIIRGYNSTTAKQHLAGSFIRQYRDDVTIIDVGTGGTITIESNVMTVGNVSVSDVSSNIITTSNILVNQNFVVSITPQVESELQIDFEVTLIDIGSTINIFAYGDAIVNFVTLVSTDTTIESSITISRSLDSIVSTSTVTERFYEYGFVDYYTENVPFLPFITTRLNGDINLDDPYNEVFFRDGGSILVRNLQYGEFSTDKFTIMNLGNSLGKYNNWYSMDTGTASVSALTFNDFDINYPTFTIDDFNVRANTQFSYSGDVWNLGYSSIQNPITISQSSGTIGSTLLVENTSYFPSSGYLFHEDRGVIRYTGKTSTSFTGCTVYSGSTTITSGSLITPYSI